MVLRKPLANAGGNCPLSIKVPGGQSLVARSRGPSGPEVLDATPRRHGRIGKGCSDG